MSYKIIGRIVVYTNRCRVKIKKVNGTAVNLSIKDVHEGDSFTSDKSMAISLFIELF